MLLLVIVCTSLIGCKKGSTKLDEHVIQQNADDAAIIKENASSRITDQLENQQSTSDNIFIRRDNTLEIVGEDYKGLGNLEVNVKDYQNDVLVCRDPVYGVTYYVNYGFDFYIYRIKSGVSELVIELPSKRLFCKDGYLYFIIEDYEVYDLVSATNGNVMKYNPISGTVEKVIDAASLMYVYEDGIYYEFAHKLEYRDDGSIYQKIDYSYYSFETKQTEALETRHDNVFIRSYKWKDYFFGNLTEQVSDDSFESTHYALLSLDSKEVIKVWDYFSQTSRRCFANDKFYAKTLGNGIKVRDMITGVTEILPVETPNLDFTIIGDMLYCGNLIGYNLQTGEQRAAHMDDYDKEVISQYYTDGTNLYVIMGAQEGAGKSYIRQIVLRKNTEGIESVNTEGATLIENGYSYAVYSMDGVMLWEG